MEQIDLFGSEIYEYLFLIEPDQKTSEKLIRFRSLLNSITPLSEEILHSKPHISLCYFEASDSSEEYILTRANQVLSAIKSFNIQVDGTELWNQGTFILKVTSDYNTTQLQDQLSLVFKGVIKNLHVTIARNIPKQALIQLPVEDLQYKNEFNCESIEILKKLGNKPYQVLSKIYLEK